MQGCKTQQRQREEQIGNVRIGREIFVDPIHDGGGSRVDHNVLHQGGCWSVG